MWLAACACNIVGFLATFFSTACVSNLIMFLATFFPQQLHIYLWHFDKRRYVCIFLLLLKFVLSKIEKSVLFSETFLQNILAFNLKSAGFVSAFISFDWKPLMWCLLIIWGIFIQIVQTNCLFVLWKQNI